MHGPPLILVTSTSPGFALRSAAAGPVASVGLWGRMRSGANASDATCWNRSDCSGMSGTVVMGCLLRRVLVDR
ncbi:hypothetical protein [Streptomyces coerulescens]|uniref:hypothetical protein n=1 Tax=Streptomyces coerulescens TaxID=29304 RepID=UPI0036D2A5FC